MKKLPIDDFYTHGAIVREDGRVLRDMYVMQVKSAAEFQVCLRLLQAPVRHPRQRGLPSAR